MTLLSGFLGAGKTTLLNRILSTDHGLKVAVVVNDFGDVSIDAELIVGTEDGTITLANGCICCTIRDDLTAAVSGLLRRDDPPEHIVVEQSGVSEPRSVLFSFRVMEQKWPLSIDAVVAIVDAEQFPSAGDRHYLLAREQIAVADVVVLNKIDLVGTPELVALRRRIAEYVPGARLLECSYAEVPLELVIGVGSRATQPLLEPDGAPGGVAHGFSTFTYRSDEPLSLDRLREACLELPASVFRAKGVVHLAERPEHRVLLQVVGHRASVNLLEPWAERRPETTIVLVGGEGGIDEAEVRRRFDACRASGRAAGSFRGALRFLRSLGDYWGKPKARI